MARYLGGLLTADETQVRPADNFEDTAGNGVFTSDEQLMLNKQSLYPTSGNSNPSKSVENVFSTYLYDGTGSTISITNGIDLSNEGGMTWFKRRNGSGDHQIFDTARTGQYSIEPNTTTAEYNHSGLAWTPQTNGFNLLGDGGTQTFNSNGDTFVSWTFRKAPNFFDVVTYTGTGSNRTVSHSLGSVPGAILIKNLSETDNWAVYHRGADSSAPQDKYLILNSTATVADSTDWWNDTAPTSSVFTVGSDHSVNANGENYVAYIFGHDTSSDGMIQCGVVTLSGNDATVNLGFEPQWVLFKPIDGNTNWEIHDSTRAWAIEQLRSFNIDTSSAEVSYNGKYSWATSTGFQTTGWFQANKKLSYIAVRKAPMATPTSRASVFSLYENTSGNDAGNTVVSATNPPFPIDLLVHKQLGSREWDVASRAVSSNRFLQTNSTNAQASETGWLSGFDRMEGYKSGSNGGVFNSSTNSIAYFWKRAPGFCDVVTYDGDGGVSTVQNHNLKVVPEMIWYKARSETGNWGIYHKDLVSSGEQVYLNLDFAGTQSYGSLVAPTTTQFCVGGNACAGGTNNTNKSSEEYVAFLFATLSGISKVGSFSHTNGASTDVDCGFSSGSSFVIVKRSDATGDWYVWDSARGIVASDDGYILLNSTAAEVTNTDYIDPLSSGFQIASGFTTGDYIFYAIAA
tara:strand:- start:556 stop:2604 length:2049 start_codon:yes stop_codon:yes gene_type:complete